MKNKLFLLILLLLAASRLSAQSLDAKTDVQRWNICMGSIYSNYHITGVFHFDNNYINYGSFNYKILYVNSDDIVNYMYAVYRESNGKVYMIDANKSASDRQEYLIYDWTMEVGDVAVVRYGASARRLVLDQITDTVLNNTARRRVFHLHYETNPELTEIWIEGIGSELGFPFSGTKDNPESMVVDAELLCYYEDGTQIWDNPNYDGCLINYWDVEENSYDELGAYPNPTHGIVTINLSGQKENTIEVYDMTGTRMMRFTGYGEYVDIDLTNFPCGLYNIIIYDDEKYHHVKIVKK